MCRGGGQDRDPGEDDQQFALSRFVPLLQEVLEDMAASNLSPDDYPFVSAPAPDGAPPCCHQLLQSGPTASTYSGPSLSKLHVSSTLIS